MLQPRFIPFPVLQTERLLLRKPTTDDAPTLFELRSSDNVMRFINKARANSIEDALHYLKILSESLAKCDGITWAIALKDRPAELIGTIGYWRLVKEHHRAEIGYMLHPDFWRKGIMKEALQAVIPYGFNELQLHSIEARVDPGNDASDAILRSAGFVREAYFKEDFYYDGRFLDTAIYSLLQ